ncbi:hypothetical protein CK621_05860 [Vandammella animalimorsus]|uniref:Uncharacterized protein n=1 Tax=Vandammella animalimorsus TaxID=2029117 RepID=A0A2A2AZ96_9BURK|nr:hypothetical protein CK621_05860 [Vandammella animalimorsus]
MLDCSSRFVDEILPQQMAAAFGIFVFIQIEVIDSVDGVFKKICNFQSGLYLLDSLDALNTPFAQRLELFMTLFGDK